MDVNAIQPSPIVQTAAENVVSSHLTYGQSSGDLYLAVLSFYKIQLHAAVMKASARFAEVQKQIWEDKERSHKVSREKREQDEASRLVGQRRAQELILGDSVAVGVRRQAGKFRFHEGVHIDSTRHLSLPV